MDKAEKLLRENPSQEKVMLGRKVLELEFMEGGRKYTYRGSMHKAWGLPDGSAFIEGIFSGVPEWVFKKAHVMGLKVTGVSYKDEAKAVREGLEHPERPWLHEFKHGSVRAYKVQGGLLIKGKCRIWEMR